ncbi:MAG: hypothetical protein A3J79_08830, partial [Elusimicrobia bacterium RIFOXYB2_FULL_62_6]
MTNPSALYARIRQIIEAAHTAAARSVNTAQVASNWLIGREIVEEEQQGMRRARYGAKLMQNLALRLGREYGPGYGILNLKLFKRFYLTYPELTGCRKGYAVRNLFQPEPLAPLSRPDHTLQERGWKPGVIHSNLSWTHYRRLLHVDTAAARAFYEIEAITNNWSARELERQVDSLLYERLALSKDKEGLLQLSKKGQQIQEAIDLFKDPVVIEFLGLPESPRLQESALEQALIDNLKAFLLEMGKGFAFVARQERLTLDGDHFYIDLVFYHTVLKCFIIIDLKAGKLTHHDLGQLQLYVNYYDRERRSKDDNPTLGLILCADKNDAVVRYTLGEAQGKTLFA